MSQTIDRKVVEMQFDNSNFETNVKQSMSTLDKLKENLKLEDSAEGFKNISKAAKDVSFDGLNKGIEDVKVHFSALQVAAATALANITNKAVDAGLAMAKSLSIDLTNAGFSQYEKKTQSVQTIMNATGKDIDEVNASLEKLIWFADETSYSFSDMVDNVGKFTSVGVDLDVAAKAMMGISNWAAVSGQNAQTASRAMYNLSQAMGLGYVGLMDWKSIELANMATSEFKQQVIDTAVAMGKLNEGQVTTQNFRESLNDKWFDNDVLLGVLGNYGNYTELVYDRVQETGELCAEAMDNVAKQMGDSYAAIGEKALRAAQEAKTFTDAVEATKDAVKSQWATLFESVFGNYDEARITFTNFANSLWEVFAGPLSDFNDVVAEAMGVPSITLEQWRGLTKDMRTELGLTGAEWTSFENVLKQAARDSGIDIDEIISKNFGDFEASLNSGWLTTDLFNKAVAMVQEGMSGSGADALSSVQDIVNRIWAGEFGNGESRREALEALGYDYDEIQALVEKGYQAEITLDDLGEKTKAFFATSGEGLDSLKEKLDKADTVESFKEIAQYMSGAELRNGIWDNLINSDTGALVTYVGAIRDAFHEIFGTIESGTIHDFLVDLYARTSALLDEERIERFKATVENIFHAIHAGITVLKGAFSVIKAVYNNTLGPILSGLWNIVKALVDGIGGLFAKLDEGVDSMTVFSDAVDWLNQKLAPVKNVIKAVTDGIVLFINSLFSGESVFKSFQKSVENIIDNIFGHDGNGFLRKVNFRNFLEKIVNLKDAVVETFANIGETVSSFWTAFQNTELGQSLAGVVENIGKALSGAWDTISKWITNLFKFDSPKIDLFDGIKSAFESFNNWLDNLDTNSIAQNISNKITTFKNTVFGAFQKVGSWLSENETFKNVLGFITEKFNELRDAVAPKDDGGEKEPFITRVLNGIRAGLEWFKENLPSIITTLKGMLGAGVLGSIIALVLKLRSAIGGRFGLLGSITGVFKGVKKALKGFAFEQYTEGIFNLAKSFALILGVLGAIAYFVEPGSIRAVGEAVFVMALGLSVLASAIGEIIKAIKKDDNDGLTGKDILFKSLGNSLEDLAGGASKFMKFAGIAAMLVGVAAALAVMTGAVIALSQIDTGALIKGVTTVIALIAALTVAMKVMTSGTTSSFSIGKGGLSASGTGSASSGLGFIGMATAILMFVAAISLIAKYDLNTIVKGVSTIGALLLEMSVMTRIASKGFTATNGISLVATAIAISSFVKTIGKIRKYDLNDILKGIITLGAIMLEVGVFTRLLAKNSGDNMWSAIGQGANLILIAGAISLFVKSVKNLSEIRGNDLANGIGALVGILAGIAGFVWVISKVTADTESLGKTLLGVAGIIAAIAAAIWVVSDAISKGVNLSEIGKGVSELAVSLVDGLVNAIVNSADSIISGLLTLFSKLVEYAPQLVDVLVDLITSVLDSLTERLPELATSIANFCGALIESFAEAFKDVDISSLVTAINEILFATASLVVIGKFGSIGSVAKGIVMLAEVIGAFGLIIAAFGALNLIPGFADFMNGGISVLVTIADGIGSFFGTLIGSFIGTSIESFSSSLPNIATYLSEFMTNLDPFIQGCSGIDSTFVSSIENLVAAMLVIAGGTFVDSIVNAVNAFFFGNTNGTETYISKFASLADGIAEFANKIKDVDFTAVDGATAAAQVIMTLANVIPTEGSIFDWIFGTKDFSKAKTYFGDLGEGVAAFCTAVSSITASEETVSKAGTAAEAIAKLTDVIPAQDGLFQWITGAPDLTNAGTNFGNLGAGVAAFCSEIENLTVSEETVSKAGTAAEAIAKLTEVAPNQNGLFQWIVGAPDFTSAGVGFGALGEGVVSFCNAVGTLTISSTELEKVGIAADAISKLTDATPNKSGSGIFEWLVGAPNFEESATDFESLGVGVTAFCNSIADITTDADIISKAGTAADAIAALTNVMPSENGLFQWITGAPDLANADTKFGNLGKGVAAFCGELTGASIDSSSAETAGTAADVIKKLIDITPGTGGIWQDIVGEKDLGKMGDNLGILGAGVSAFLEATKNTTKSAITRGEIAADGMIEILGKSWPTEGGIWGSLINGIAGGNVSFEDLKEDVDTIGAMCQSMVTSFGDISSDSITSAKTAAEGAIAILKLEWPSTNEGIFGAVAAFFTGGGTDFDTLGEIAEKIATFIKDFSTNLSGLDYTATVDVSIARAALSGISDILSFIPAEVTDPTEFATAATKAVTGAKVFSEKAAEISSLNVYTGTTAVSDLLAMLEEVSDADFDDGSAFSTALGNLADSGISEFVSAFEDAETNTIQTVTDFLTSITDTLTSTDDFTTAGSDDGQGFNDGFATWVDPIKTSLSTLMTDMLNSANRKLSFYSAANDNGREFKNGFEVWIPLILAAITSLMEQSLASADRQWSFYSAGNENAQGLNNGFSASSYLIANTVSSIMSSAASNANQYWAFWTAGTYCMSGVIAGMNAYAPYVYSTASTIGTYSVIAFNSAIGANSPAKEFIKSGMYSDMGIAKGLNDYAYLVNNAAEEVAEEPIDIIQTTLSGINLDGLDNAPTIRPVLDLSNIQNGAGLIDEMLHTENAIGIDALEAQQLANSINSLHLDSASINGVYDDSDIIAVINDLGDRVDNLNAAINNMKLYLNGKQLVGGIVTDMDDALGNLSTKKNKGVL